MKRRIFLLIIGVLTVTCFPLSVIAQDEEEIVLTTYYPAPLGTYDELVVSGDTYLAVDSGGVAIGASSAPTAMLDIVGDGDTVIVPRKSDTGDPAAGINGMIYYNEADKKFRAYEDGTWKDLIGGAGGAGDVEVSTGTYLGDGVDDRAIAVAFQPDIVIVMGDDNDSSQPWICRTLDMAATISKEAHGPIHSNGIKSLTATGFTVGTNQVVNKAGTNYFFIAIKKS